MKKTIFSLFVMLFAISINYVNADVTTLLDTTNVVVSNANMYPNDTTTTFIGNDTTESYEVGVTFNNDTTTDSLSIIRIIDNAYVYSFEDSDFVCKFFAEDSLYAMVTLDTTANTMSIYFMFDVVDTIGDNNDTIVVNTFNIDMTYNIQDPTAVENVAIVSPYNVWTEGNVIVLNGADGEMVAIYDVNGRLVSYKVATSDNVRYAMNSGVYFIKIGNSVMKALVK